MIEQGHLRPVFLDQRQCRQAILSLSDDLNQPAAGQRPYQAIAEQRMVIGDDHRHPLVVESFPHQSIVAQPPWLNRSATTRSSIWWTTRSAVRWPD